MQNIADGFKTPAVSVNVLVRGATPYLLPRPRPVLLHQLRPIIVVHINDVLSCRDGGGGGVAATIHTWLDIVQANVVLPVGTGQVKTESRASTVHLGAGLGDGQGYVQTCVKVKFEPRGPND